MTPQRKHNIVDREKRFVTMRDVEDRAEFLTGLLVASVLIFGVVFLTYPQWSNDFSEFLLHATITFAGVVVLWVAGAFTINRYLDRIEKDAIKEHR